MDLQDYQALEGEVLKDKIRSLARSERDEQLDRFGGQYAVLCQRLEALYSPGREDQFLSLRPGGLDEIDKAIAQADPTNPKELALLKSFRELNRVLLPFMDVYEEQVLGDLKHMSKEELETLYANASRDLTAAEELLKKYPHDNRRAQNASGTIRLTTLVKDAIQRELNERFGPDIL